MLKKTINFEQAIASELANGNVKTPTRIVTRETQSVYQNVSTVNAFNFTLQETATYKRENRAAFNSHILQKFTNEKDHLAWYRSDLGDLLHLLDMARNPKRCGEIAPKDLKRIVKFCNRKRGLVVDSKEKLAKIAFRTLNYIAKNRYPLSKKALKALINELDRKNEKTLPYTVLALSYAILNEQLPMIEVDIRPLLFKAVNILKTFDQYQYLNNVIVGLAALTKLGEQLSLEDLEIIKICLLKIEPKSKHPLFSESELKTEYVAPETLVFNSRTRSAELNNMKANAKKGNLLPADHLSFLNRRWSRDVATNIKILKVIRHAIAHGQRRFPEHEEITKILEESLVNHEEKISNNARIAVSYLIVNDELQHTKSDSKINGKFEESLLPQYEHALLALINDLEEHDKEINVNEWNTIITQFEDNKKLKPKINYLIALFKKNIDAVKSQLLDPDHCIEASMAVLSAVKKGARFEKDTLISVSELFNENKKYALEAKINILRALGYIVGRDQHSLDPILKSIKKILDVDDEALINETLLLLGLCIADDLKKLIVTEIFTKIPRFLQRKNLAYNASFLFVKLMEQLQEGKGITQLQQLLESASEQLNDNNIDVEAKKNIALALCKAFALKNNNINNSKVLKHFVSSLHNNTDRNVQRRIIVVIGLMINSVDKFDLPEKIIDAFVKILKTGDQELKNYVRLVLNEYIKKTSTPLNDTIIERLSELLTDIDAAPMLCDVLLTISETDKKFSNSALKKLVALFQSSNCELRLQASMILRNLASKQLFAADVFSYVEAALEDTEQDIVANLVIVLKSIPKQTNVAAAQLGHKLTRIALDYQHKMEMRVDAITVLINLSRQGFKLKLEHFAKIAKLLESTDDQICLMVATLLELQMPLMRVSIMNNNPITNDILNLVLKKLSETNSTGPMLAILTRAQENGYKVPIVALPELSHLIIRHKLSAINQAAFIVLQNINPLPEEYKPIIFLEKSAITLLQNTAGIDQQKTALQYLLHVLQEKKEITNQCFLAIETLLKKSDTFKKEGFDICLQAIQNGQELPHNLVDTIYAYVNIQGTMHANVVVQIIACLAKKGAYVPQEVIDGIEKCVTVAVTTLPDCLIILDIAVKRGFCLQQETLNHIIALLDDINICHSATKIVTSLMNSTTSTSYSFEHLTKNFSKVSDEQSAKELSLALSCMMLKNSNITANAQNLLLVEELLNRSNNDIEMEVNLLKALEKQQLQQEFPENIMKLINLKKQTHVLLSKKATLSEKQKALSLLKADPQLFSSQCWLALQAMLQPFCLRNRVNNTVIIEQEQELLLILDNLSVMIRWGCLPENLLAELADILINYPTNVIRKSVLQIIKLLLEKQQLPEHLNYLTTIVAVEYNGLSQDSNKETFAKKILDTVRCGFPLTQGNIEVLCKNFFQLSSVTRADIATVLKQNKQRIPTRLQSILAKNIITIVSKANAVQIDNHQSKQLCLELIPLFGSEDLYELFLQLQAFINSGKITNYNLALLNALTEKLEIIDCEKLIINLIKRLYKKTDPDLQHAVITTVFKLCRKTSLFSKEANVQIAGLVRIINPVKKEEKILAQLKNFISNKIKNRTYSPAVQKVALGVLNYVYYASNGLLDCSLQLVKLLEQLFYKHRPHQNSLLKKINTLDQKINFMLTSLTCDCGEIADILDDSISPEMYSRELLCNELLMHVNKDSNFDRNRIEFYQNLTRFEISKKHVQLYDKTRDKFIRELIIKQQNEALSLSQINDILYMLTAIKQDYFMVVNNSLAEIKCEWIIFLCENFLDINIDRNSTVKTINSLLDNLNWNIKTIVSFFRLSHNVHVDQLVDILRFLDKYKITEQQTVNIMQSGEVKTIFDIRTTFIDKLLLNKVTQIVEELFYSKNKNFTENNNEFYHCHRTLYGRLKNLLNQSWDFDELSNLIYAFKIRAKTLSDKQKIKALNEMIEIFELVNFYNIPYEKFYPLFVKSALSELPRVLRKYVINTYFRTQGDEKDLLKLIDEAQQSEINKRNPKILAFLEKTALQTKLDLIKAVLRQSEKLPSSFVLKRPITKWTASDIRKWTKHIKPVANNEDFLWEMLAVMQRACYLHNNYKPRYSQMLALLALLNRESDKGRFVQVATGEGKSIIIAMLAAIKALRGEPVDIITSSPILAKRDADLYGNFYAMFNLKAASNEDNRYVKGVKSCYKEDIDIVYGDSNNFEFDILRDEYSGLETRGKADHKRKFGAVIIDEVDNLLIDEGTKLAMLANTMPGMDSLNAVLIALWHELQLMLFNIRVEYNAGKLSYEKYSLQSIRDHLKQYLKKITEGNDNSQKQEVLLNIPEHLKEFINIQSKKWIESAIHAHFNCKEGRDYRVKINDFGKKVIVPVDFSNTGILQQGTTWSDALQQFLQIKHGLQITPETLTTNFMSNIALIERYGRNVFGTTATMGSVASQRVLEDIYHIDFVDIPTHKEKRLIPFPSIIEDSTYSWIQTISDSSIREAKSGRVVLVVCESINSAQEIYEKISAQSQHASKILLYSENDLKQGQFLEKKVAGNTIIVATNLATRGADIKLIPEAVQQGGLHVCCSFLPENERVENQISGRAARKGEPGSVQIVLNRIDLINKFPNEVNLYTDFAQVKEFRDQAEQTKLNHAREIELPRIQLKDELFSEYKKLILELDKVDNDTEHYQKFLKENVGNTSPQICEYMKLGLPPYKRASVEQCWGMWLKKHNIETAKHKLTEEETNKIKQDFFSFKINIIKKYETETVILNPCYYIQQGNFFLIKANSFSNVGHRDSLNKLAIVMYDKAIALDQNSYLAYYHKACALIKLGEEVEKDKQNYDLLLLSTKPSASELEEYKKKCTVLLLKEENENYQIICWDKAGNSIKKQLASDKFYARLATFQFTMPTPIIDREIKEKIYEDVTSVAGHIAVYPYKEAIKSCLQKAIQAVEKSLQHEQANSFLTERVKLYTKIEPAKDLAEQLSHNTQVLTAMLSSINLALAEIERTQRLIDVIIEHEGTEQKFTKRNQQEALFLLDNGKASNIKIRFHDLTKHDDLLTSYQSINTIEKLKNPQINIIYKSSKLTAHGDIKHELKKLLPINQNEKEVVLEQQTESHAEKKEKIGLQEHVSAIKDGAKNIAKKAGDAVIGVAKKPFASAYTSINERRFHLEKAKQLPVSVSMENIALSKALHLVKSQLSFTTEADAPKIEEPKNAEKSRQSSHSKKQNQVPLQQEKVQQQPITVDLTIRDIGEKAAAYIKQSPYVHLACFETSVDSKTTIDGKPVIIETKITDHGVMPENYNVCFVGCSLEQTEKILQYLSAYSANIDVDKSKSLSNDCIFNLELSLHQLSQQRAEKIIDDAGGDITISFNGLQKGSAKDIIHLNDAQHDNTCFELVKLTADDAIRLVEEADRKEQNLSMGLKSVDDEFLKISDLRTWLAELKANGHLYLFDVKEKKPMPWKSLSLITGLGLIQIAVGFALMGATMGFGANFGASLIGEGIGDLMRAFTIAYTREFSVTSYLAQKSLSLAISLISAGWASYQSSVSAVNKLAEMTDDVVLTAARLGMADSFRSAAIHVGTTIAKTSVSEVVNASFAVGGKVAAESLRTRILEYANEKMKREFSEGFWRHTLNRLLAIDQFTGDVYYGNKIKIKAQAAIGKIPFAIPGIQAFDFNGIDQFYIELNEYVHELNEQSMSFPEILEKHLQRVENITINADEVKQLCNVLKMKKILTGDHKINIERLKRLYGKKNLPPENSHYDDIENYDLSTLYFGDSECLEKHKKNIIKACILYEQMIADDHYYKIETLSKEIAQIFGNLFQDSVETIFVQIAELASKGVSYGTNYGLNLAENSAISSNQQHKEVSVPVSAPPVNQDDVSDTIDQSLDGTNIDVEIDKSVIQCKMAPVKQDFKAWKQQPSPTATLNHTDKPLTNKGFNQTLFHPVVSQSVTTAGQILVAAYKLTLKADMKQEVAKANEIFNESIDKQTKSYDLLLLQQGERIIGLISFLLFEIKKCKIQTDDQILNEEHFYQQLLEEGEKREIKQIIAQAESIYRECIRAPAYGFAHALLLLNIDVVAAGKFGQLLQQAFKEYSELEAERKFMMDNQKQLAKIGDTNGQGYDFNNLTSGAVDVVSTTVNAVSTAIIEYQKTKQTLLKIKGELAKEIVVANQKFISQVEKLQKGRNKTIETAMEKFTNLCDGLQVVITENAKNVEKHLKSFQDDKDFAQKQVTLYPNDETYKEIYTEAVKTYKEKYTEITKSQNELCNKQMAEIRHSKTEFNDLVKSLELSNDALIIEAMKLQSKMVDLTAQMCKDFESKTDLQKIKNVSTEEPKPAFEKKLDPNNTPGNLITSAGNFGKRMPMADLKLIKQAETLLESVANPTDKDIKEQSKTLSTIVQKCRTDNVIGKDEKKEIEDLIKYIGELAELQVSVAKVGLAN